MTPGDFSMFYPNGSVDNSLVDTLSRPYAEAVAGTITHNSFVRHVERARGGPANRSSGTSWPSWR